MTVMKKTMSRKVVNAAAATATVATVIVVVVIVVFPCWEANRTPLGWFTMSTRSDINVLGLKFRSIDLFVCIEYIFFILRTYVDH